MGQKNRQPASPEATIYESRENKTKTQGGGNTA